MSEIREVPIVSAASEEKFDRPGFRLTASQRPGVAQPVPERDIPERPWQPIFIGAVVLFVLLMTGWEGYWRAYGVTPAYANSNDSWAAQRRRIDNGEGKALVLIGSSRTLFDVQLPVWEKITGERPIQLALEGTSAVPAMEDLADDPNFTGRLMVGVTPGLFFSGSAYRGDAIKHYPKQSLSQRSGHWLSQHFVEPYFAFYDQDFALNTVLKRQAWPDRPGRPARMSVRKLSLSDADRNTHMWPKVENDVTYRDMARSIWAQNFAGPPPPFMDTPEKAQKVVAKQIERAQAALVKLRARGVQVVFARLPSSGDFYTAEQKAMPRATTWEVLLQKTGAPGVHFEDYPQLQGFTIPEWSHIASAEADKFTAAFAPLVQEQFAAMKAAQPGASK